MQDVQLFEPLGSFPLIAPGAQMRTDTREQLGSLIRSDQVIRDTAFEAGDFILRSLAFGDHQDWQVRVRLLELYLRGNGAPHAPIQCFGGRRPNHLRGHELPLNREAEGSR